MEKLIKVDLSLPCCMNSEHDQIRVVPFGYFENFLNGLATLHNAVWSRAQFRAKRNQIG
jgi:hypothetical protein